MYQANANADHLASESIPMMDVDNDKIFQVLDIALGIAVKRDGPRTGIESEARHE